MNNLISELVAQLDLAESQSTTSHPWKPIFDEVVTEIAVLNKSVKAQLDQSQNPLFRLLARQNEILMSLAVIGIIAGQKK